jgi:uncharacterized protein (TIGR00304 family)
VHETLLHLGIAFVILGVMVLFIYGMSNSAQQGQNGTAKSGGVIMIGPIPIVFGSSGDMAVLAEALAIILIILYVVFFFILGKR